jgi:hypothetical protein
MTGLREIQFNYSPILPLATIHQRSFVELIHQAHAAGVAELQGATQEVNAATLVKTNHDQRGRGLGCDRFLSLDTLDHLVVGGDHKGA